MDKKNYSCYFCKNSSRVSKVCFSKKRCREGDKFEPDNDRVAEYMAQAEQSKA